MPSLKRERQEMDEGARKRIKVSPPAVHTTITDDVPEHNMPPDPPMPLSQESQALQLLRGDFDDLRQLITCKICERLMYEPYVISCGHTYCYSCLCTWFATTKKKTCPNCREVIAQPPAPSYVIKEMTHIFMRRHDLLPDGETVEEHQQWKEEEAELVRKDRADTDPRTGGLFKGFFRPRRPKLHAIHDPVDHVDRCPHCNWEVEDGMCNNCGIHMDDTSDSDNSLDGEDIPDDFDDEDLDADPGYGELDLDFDPRLRQYMSWRDLIHDVENRSNYSDSTQEAIAREMEADLFYETARAGDGRFLDMFDEDAEDDEDNEDDEDEDDSGSIDDFIDDRDPHDITTHTISSQPEELPRRRHRRAVISSDQDDDDAEEDAERDAADSDASRTQAESASEFASDSESDGMRHNPLYRSRSRARAGVPVPTVNLDTDDDDDDDEPRVIGSRSRHPPGRQHQQIRIIDSDEEESNEEDSDEEVDDDDDDDDDIDVNVSRANRNMVRLSRDFERGTHAVDDSEQEDLEDEDEDDIDHEGSIEGFSPLQSEGEDQLDAFNVYGAADADDGEEGGAYYEDEREDW